VSDSFERASQPLADTVSDTLHELELRARLAELDRSIRALERERERFLRLRYATHLIEAELLHLRAERAEIRSELRVRRAATPDTRPATSLRVRLTSLALGALITLGVAAVAFRASGDVSSPARPTATSTAPAPPSAAAPRAPEASATPAALQGGAFVPETPQPTPTPGPRYAVVATEQLNVRIGPGMQYAIRRAVPAGTVLRLVGERRDEAGNTWWELDQGGWVHGGYVQLAASESEARAAAERLP
jgi:uncharacterized protein YgiM (DUF1202 family)